MDRWTVLLPLRGSQLSKTRLAADLPAPHLAPALAQTMAWDVMEAAVTTHQVDRVVLLTSNPLARAVPEHLAIDPRVQVSQDRFMPGLDPLNAALTAWLAINEDRYVAVVMPDLPCMTPGDLSAALNHADPGFPCFIPDQEGTGTVLLAGPAAHLVPQFGSGSAQRHAESALRIQIDAPRLRRDVDTGKDLADAIRLGVGGHTEGLLVDCGFTLRG